MFSSENSFGEWKLRGFQDSSATLFETIQSTHTLMKEKALSGEIQAGALFVADRQTGGRGRHERTWESPAGKNLYFNILIPLDDIPANRFPQLTQVAALTFAETFNKLLELPQHMPNANIVTKPNSNDSDMANCGAETTPNKITVKWPNDILFGKSKFCGILAEIVYIPQEHGSRAPALNMGVGINVNSDPEEYASLNRPVTTLKAIAGRRINREHLLQALVGNLERALGQFKAFGIAPWVNAWRKMDQFIGARGTIIISKSCMDQNRNGGEGVEKKSGSILDMEDDGSLKFQTDDGIIHTVYSADLEI